MVECPHCGESLTEDAAYCHNCGNEVASDPASEPTDSDTSSASQEPAAGESQPPQSPDSAAGEAAPQADQAATAEADSSGIGRREVIFGGALLGAIGIAWFVFGRDDDGHEAMSVYEQLWDAWDEGDADTYRNLVHSESPLRDEGWWDDDAYWEQLGPGPDEDYDTVSREVVTETDSVVIIEEQYAWQHPEWDDGCFTDRYEFRLDDGSWRYYDVEHVEQEAYDECY